MWVREVEHRYGRTVGQWKSTRILSPESVARFLHEHLLADRPHELFCTLLLDGRHKPIGVNVVSKGTLTASLVHPREVFAPALAQCAAAMVLAHNHPSGNPAPSAEDRSVTIRLGKAAKLLGITLIDHLIIGESALKGGCPPYWAFSEGDPGALAGIG